jgi:hypothetical protein
MGWRYLIFCLGGLTLLLWALRFLLFTFHESPRFLIGLGKDAEAIAVLQKVAAYNGRTCSLTVEDLQKAAQEAVVTDDGPQVLSKSSNYSWDHIKALFATRKLGWSTSLLIALWGTWLQSSIYHYLTCIQVSSDLRLRSITASCHTCEF